MFSLFDCQDLLSITGQELCRSGSQPDRYSTCTPDAKDALHVMTDFLFQAVSAGVLSRP